MRARIQGFDLVAAKARPCNRERGLPDRAHDATMRQALQVTLASPRGFCAGVERAIRTVEDALAAYGPPVYVRHEIVHNAHVVARLKAMGAVFVDDVAEAPNGRPLIFSAHGAPRSAHEAAKARPLTMIDATCPLVQKVHAETRRSVARGRHVMLIGHKGHPEVEGTIGQVFPGAVTLIETEEQAEAFQAPAAPLSYVTQTTLSVDDAAAIVAVLTRRFPDIVGPKSSDICYATSNRQAAVKKVAERADLVLIIGSPTSSNSCRLVEVARAAGCARAELIEDPETCDLSSVEGVRRLGISSGASAPEILVESLLARLAERFRLSVETVEVARETVSFKAPALLAG
jgi:4-hydroxy-3-methylbut-2-enyl diphosphate reductase